MIASIKYRPIAISRLAIAEAAACPVVTASRVKRSPLRSALLCGDLASALGQKLKSPVLLGFLRRWAQFLYGVGNADQVATIQYVFLSHLGGSGPANLFDASEVIGGLLPVEVPSLDQKVRDANDSSF